MRTLIIILTCFLVSGCVNPMREIVEERDVDLTASEEQRIKNVVRSNLIDPTSVIWGRIMVKDFTYSDGSRERVICVEANAKNRFGGYVGETVMLVNLERNDMWTPRGTGERSCELAMIIGTADFWRETPIL